MLNNLLTGDAAWFGVPALVGTGLFLLRMGLMLLGHGHAGDMHPGDLHTADAHALENPAHAHNLQDPHNAAGAFKLLSIQALMAFAMGFGWGGIAGLYTFQWSFPRSIIAGVAAGAAMVWVLAALLRAVGLLQRDGATHLESAVGCEGEVYVGIPPEGQGAGQVRVVVSDRLRIVNARSLEGPLATQSKVRILHVNPDNTVAVAPV